jgi:hypothetical protein
VHLLDKTWESPVFGDSFGNIGPDKLAIARQQMGEIAARMTTDLSSYVHDATLQEDRSLVLEMVSREILPKTIAFCPALTIGEIDDIPRLSAFSTAIGLMYWADQSIDRGSQAMLQAVELLPDIHTAANADLSPEVQRATFALGKIADKVNSFATPEDVPLVLDCFYDQVLLNEALIRRLSLAYAETEDPTAFLATHAENIAVAMTIDAGFPSVSSSLYAIYRQHDTLLPPLSEIYNDPAMTDVLQACNATVRIWDELGDWQMDRGIDPTKGVFTINLFNEYHEAIVSEICSFAGIREPAQRMMLQESFAAFHEDETSRQLHGARIDDMLLGHIRQYILDLPQDIQQQFGKYLTLCKRVLEIGYVNRAGDIALTDKAE